MQQVTSAIRLFCPRDKALIAAQLQSMHADFEVIEIGYNPQRPCTCGSPSTHALLIK